MQNKKNSFVVSNPPKCIANLRIQPMYFNMNLEIYQTSFVMKEVVLSYYKDASASKFKCYLFWKY